MYVVPAGGRRTVFGKNHGKQGARRAGEAINISVFLSVKYEFVQGIAGGFTTADFFLPWRGVGRANSYLVDIVQIRRKSIDPTFFHVPTPGGVGRGREISVVVLGIELESESNLPKVCGAFRPVGLLFGRTQRGKYEPGKNGDQSADGQNLQEGEPVLPRMTDCVDHQKEKIGPRFTGDPGFSEQLRPACVSGSGAE